MTAFLFRIFVCGLPFLRMAAQQIDPAPRVYAQASKSVFLIIVRSSAGETIAQGTGFLVARNKIVTNQHVVREGTPYLDLGAARLPLKVEAVDTVNDLAVLSFDGELSGNPLSLTSTELAPGTAIYAIGNPAGLERSISNGVVAGIRQIAGRELVQISAPISPGSSGGPILNARSEVVAVAVGILEQGQNLNFAIPAKLLQRLLSGAPPAADVPSLLARAEELYTKQWRDEKYSEEPDSPFQRLGREVETILTDAFLAAGVDMIALNLIFEKAFERRSPVAVRAAEKVLQIKPSAEAYLMLAKSLKAQYINPSKDTLFLEKSEKAIRSTFTTTKQPTLEMYALLADILEDRMLTIEAKAAFLKAYDLAKAQNNSIELASAARGLTRVSSSVSNNAEVDRWFKVLADSGQAQPYDWVQQAERLSARREFKIAGDYYVQGASQLLWRNYCLAAASYFTDGNQKDLTLEAARACIANGANKANSDASLAVAHRQIADVLNERGVYDEALSHAREAVSIDPTDTFFQDTLSDSFFGLRRFQEAINASKQAIRLSDGKYAWMHFHLGSAYFGTENWELAKQSYEKAAELDPKDSVAAYNLALCFTRLRFYRDAANWYEEMLRRNPNDPKRADVLLRIQSLRK